MGTMKNSELTFNELTKDLLYVQVWWNGNKVYDDYEGETTLNELHQFEEKYGGKIVYSMYVEVVEFHHCIIEVEGEQLCQN